MATKFLETLANHEKLPKIRAWLDEQPAIMYEKPEKPDVGRYWSRERKLSFLRQNKLGRLTLIPSPDFFKGSRFELRSAPTRPFFI